MGTRSVVTAMRVRHQPPSDCAATGAAGVGATAAGVPRTGAPRARQNGYSEIGSQYGCGQCRIYANKLQNNNVCRYKLTHIRGKHWFQ